MATVHANLVTRHSHTEGIDKEIKGKNLNINVVEMYVNIPECMMAEEFRYEMQVDDHLNTLTAFLINGWLSTRAETKEEIKQYIGHFEMA